MFFFDNTAIVSQSPALNNSTELIIKSFSLPVVTENENTILENQNVDIKEPINIKYVRKGNLVDIILKNKIGFNRPAYADTTERTGAGIYFENK